MKLVIQGVLALVAILLAYMVYDTIDSRIEFEETAEYRKSVVVEKLKDIREAQKAFKGVYGKYARDFGTLISFVKTDSMPYIKAIGTVPDTLTEVEAVQMGIVVRDTFKIAIRDTLFEANYPIDSLSYVPFAEGVEFDMDADQIEINQLQVQVFEAKADYKDIFTGLNPQNEGIKLEDGLRVGSMTDASISGNWE